MQPTDASDADVRRSQDKLFYVSPFIEMTPPPEQVKRASWRPIAVVRCLLATFNGRCRTLNNVELLRALFAFPLVTLKIVDPLRGAAAPAQGRAPGAASERRPQSPLGDREKR